MLHMHYKITGDERVEIPQRMVRRCRQKNDRDKTAATAFDRSGFPETILSKMQ